MVSLLLFLLAVAGATCTEQELGAQLQAQVDAQAEEKSVLLQDLSKLWTQYFSEVLETNSFNDSPNDTISQQCVNSTWQVLKSPHSLPAIKNVTISDALIVILDATGKQGPGLFEDNTILNGAYDECFSNAYTGYCLAEGITVNLASIGLPIVWTVEFCVPKNCNSQDLAVLINHNDLFNVDPAKIKCTKTKDPSYSAGAIVMVIVCVIFAMLALVASFVDCLLVNVPKYLKGEDDEDEDFNHPSINSEGENESDPLLRSSVIKRAEFQAGKKKFHPLDFLTAFSLFKTVPTLLATKQGANVITSLNGLRVISMFWVILGHTHFWLFTSVTGSIDNRAATPGVFSRFSFQVLGSAFFSVDSFFFLSGVLVAYLSLRQMSKAKGKFPFLKFYVHRYLRLTPAYAFVLFFAWFLTIHLASGPQLIFKDPFAEPCKKYWWTNFLYINNLYPWKLNDACVGWSWYLANDMQFYVLSPLILIPLYYLFPVGLIIGATFVVVGGIITGALSIVYDFQANTFSAVAYHYIGNSKVSNTMNFGDAIYIKPWDRIAPYVVGLVLGYILFKGVTLKRFRIPRLLKLLFYVALWVVAGFVMFWIVYGLYFTWHGHIPTSGENVVYIVLSRFLWAVCLAMIVFACHNGYGWVINSFLSMSLWTPLARMTFNAYLVHPIVMTVFYGQMQTSIHYTDITMAGYAIVFVVLSYGAAAVVCVFVEFPLGTIEMLLFDLVGKLTKRKKEDRSYVNLQAQRPGEVRA